MDSLNGKIEVPWQISLVVHDILWLTRCFSHISFQHIFREANFVAYVVALIGHFLGATKRNSSLPLSAYNALAFD